MDVAAVIQQRKIRELLHFTTNRGVTGILGDGEILPRSQLPTEKHLASVYPPNSATRYDTAHLDFVNLSISRINLRFFTASSRWHETKDVWWCVLAFDPQIATHDDVQFTTTNNMYSGCKRLGGGDGLAAAFADRVHQYLDNFAVRNPAHPAHWPTDRQAEVLYPGALPLEHLKTAYVMSDQHADVVGSVADIYECGVDIVVRPGVFA